MIELAAKNTLWTRAILFLDVNFSRYPRVKLPLNIDFHLWRSSSSSQFQASILPTPRRGQKYGLDSINLGRGSELGISSLERYLTSSAR